jgi:hypothetical protein
MSWCGLREKRSAEAGRPENHARSHGLRSTNIMLTERADGDQESHSSADANKVSD